MVRGKLVSKLGPVLGFTRLSLGSEHRTSARKECGCGRMAKIRRTRP
jgi:hypothetical protein